MGKCGMVIKTECLVVETKGKGTYEITSWVRERVRACSIGDGTVTVFLAHTSASLVIYENADASARRDLHRFFERIVPENDPSYEHTCEGWDDTTSHLRMALTRTSEVIPVRAGELCLGTWQGIFIFEHRAKPHRRTVWINVLGQAK